KLPMLLASFPGSSFQTGAGTNGGGNRLCTPGYLCLRGGPSGPFQSNAGRGLPHPGNNKRKRSDNSSSDLRQNATHGEPEAPEPFHTAPVLPLRFLQWRCMPWPARCPALGYAPRRGWLPARQSPPEFHSVQTIAGIVSINPYCSLLFHLRSESVSLINR